MNELEITFDINTIDHLGVKLYSTIPPMIAELVSNAWDADAKNVYIEFTDGDEKAITVRDDGIGMSFDDLNNQFLKIGRNRRVEKRDDTTAGGRKILGKKGLGKLSMFGIGKEVHISTVQNGKKNVFIMDYAKLKNCEDNVYKPEIVEYDAVTAESSGTTISIKHLSRKSDFDLYGVRRNLLMRFHIFSSDFKVHINDDQDLEIATNEIPEEKSQFVWSFPKDYEIVFLNSDEKDKNLFEFASEKGIQGKIFTGSTPLNKDIQGIVLFSRGKLVQEHSAFNDRANDNFFQYMCQDPSMSIL